MKKTIKFLVALGLGSVLFYFVIRRAGLGTVKEASSLFFSSSGLIIVAITLLIALVGVIRWKVVLGCQGEKRKISELLGIWVIGYSIDYLTPVSLFGGEALRVYLTGKTLGINWEKSFSSVIIDKILDGTFHLIFIVAGVAVFLSYGDFPEIWIFWIVVFTVLALTVVLTLFYSRAIGKKSILLLILGLFGLEKAQVKATKNGEFIFNTEGNVMRFFSPRQAFFWKGVLLSFLRHALIYLRAFVLILLLVGTMEPIKAIAVQGLAYLSLLLPLPAGLGGLEAISAFGFETLHFGFEKGTVFGMTWRAADLAICFLGIFFGIKITLKLFKLRIFNFIDKLFKRGEGRRL